ncbi:MAG: hypothetical protein ABSB56_04140 [Nitrososphaerales archaeon]
MDEKRPAMSRKRAEVESKEHRTQRFQEVREALLAEGRRRHGLQNNANPMMLGPFGLTRGKDFDITSSKTLTDEEKEIVLDALGEIFKFWVESKDGVVTWGTIVAIAEKCRVNQNMLVFVWQRLGFGRKVSLRLDERTRRIMLFFSRRKNSQWVEP